MKIGNQVSEAVILHKGIKKEESKDLILEWFKRLRISYPETVYNSYPHELSGGMRQRIVITIALICNPKIVIADEPTTSLDVTIQAQILELIKELRNKINLSMIIITHDLSIVADICDYVYIMYAGKIMEKGNIFDIYYNPKHPYTQGLLNSVTSINKYSKKFETIPGMVVNLISPPLGCRFNPRCNYVMDICKEVEPHLVSINKEHSVSCHLYNEKEEMTE
jgi:oligopeptide/dipeptide ABC transporter ATP-binding protein